MILQFEPQLGAGLEFAFEQNERLRFQQAVRVGVADDAGFEHGRMLH